MRLPVNTVIHTTLVGLEPTTFRSLVRRATSSATEPAKNLELKCTFCQSKQVINCASEFKITSLIFKLPDVIPLDYHMARLSFKIYFPDKINTAKCMLSTIKRNSRRLRQDTFIMLYKFLVRSHLEYANSLWNPYQKQDIKALEKVQMRATRLVTALRDRPYQEWSRALIFLL